MKAAFLRVMAASAIVAATGFVREMVLAYMFGTSAAADALSLILLYIEATYTVVSMGIAGYMLVPLVVRLDHQVGWRAAERLVETLQLWAALALIPVLLAGWLAADAVAHAMAPGFNSVQHALLTQMVPAGMTCAALLVIGALYGGVLQARGAYLGALLGRGAFNLGVVGVLYGSVNGASADAATQALLVGGMLQVAIQVAALVRIGWRPAVPRFDHLHLGSAVSAGLPAVLALFLVNFVAAAGQRVIGSTLPEGSLAAANYAQRILSVVWFFSVSLGTVSLTALSAAVTRDATGAAARAALARHLSWLAWLIVPLSLWLALASPQLVTLLFQRGAYTAASIATTAECLQWFAALLAPSGVLMILQRAAAAWDRHWLVTLSSAGLAAATIGVTVLMLPVGATALPIALLCGNLAGLIAQAWLMRRLAGQRLLLEATKTIVVCGLRASVALAPLLVFHASFLRFDGPFLVVAWRLFAGLSLSAGLYVVVGLATADRLTRELLVWGWGSIRSAGGAREPQSSR